MSYDYFQVQL